MCDAILDVLSANEDATKDEISGTKDEMRETRDEMREVHAARAGLGPAPKESFR